MATKRWLNIVVDGNTALDPYWPDIVSNYLEKIVRRFIGNVQEEGAYLGLVLYNANSELVAGYDVQFINWTKDVNKYLETLSCLPFNGNDQNQCAMAQGLADALVMYPKPSDTMSTQEYYNAERHCILVAPGDPVPRRMQVSVPMIQRGQVIGQQLHACKADFLEVAQLFALLAVSLSVISPNPFPIFGSIFNLGNNDFTLANAPTSHYSSGPFTVLLSRNFLQAHNALHENRIVGSIKSVEEISTTPAIALPRVFTSNRQEEQAPSLACEVTIGERISEASSTVRLESACSQPLNSQELVFPNATDQINVASSSSQPKMNVYDDIMAELTADKDIFTPSKRPKTCITLEEDTLNNLFQPDQLPFDNTNVSLGQEQGVSTNKNTSMEALKAVETDLEEVLRDALQSASKNQTSNVDLTASSSKEANILPQEVQPPTSSTGEGSSTGLLQGLRRKRTELNPILSSENSSNSALLVPQQHPSNLWPTGPQAWYHPSGMMNTATGLGTVGPWDPSQFPAGAARGNIAFPHAMGNSLMQFQPYSSPSQFPMFPDASSQCVRGPVGNFSGQPMGQHFPGYQYQRNHMTGFGPLYTPAMGASTNWVPPMPSTPICYPGQVLSSPSLADFQDYVHTWEGSIAGRIQSNRLSVFKAKAFRKATTPLTLTFQWTGRLEICHLLPQKAVDHTKNFSYPIDYVVFHMLKANNLDLYQHLKSTNLCAKIDLPCQSIIISPAEREHFFIGTVFPGDTLFIEPVESSI